MNCETLEQWLEYLEQLHPQAIALGLDRVDSVRQALNLAPAFPVITVGGTNGKGSCCAMLQAMLAHAGYRVGCYTSPHLLRYNERVRIGGQAADDAALCAAFARVERARGDIALTYFEFTTLVILRLLASSGLDAVILEVGLGGRLDAVNVIDADCAVITSIDLDHMAFLGPDRESIGREKAGIMRAGRPVVVSDPQPPASVQAHAAELGADLWLFGRDFNYAGDRQQWSWGGRSRRFNSMAYPSLRGANQLLNASGVLAALDATWHRLPVSAQSVRTGLATVELPGRFQIIPGQPTMILDVAHNPHAAATLAVNLDQMGFFPRTFAVWGAMADKDMAGMVTRLLPLIDHWYCCDLPTDRAASAQDLIRALPEAARSKASAHENPMAALHAALAGADPTDRIVVFGSFYTVGGVLHEGLPRLNAPHMPAA